MKQILIKATMEGCGVVNFDDKSQGFTLNNLGLKFGPVNDNVKYAKKYFFKKTDDNGNFIIKDGEFVYDYGIKISGDCIRKAIFGGDVENVNPIITNNEIVACNYFLSPVAINRGYLYTIKDDSGYKRKSCLTITDAKEISGAKSEFEIGTTSGERNSTSMFYTEKVGETKYEFNGIIDLKTLMFIVADPMFDRMALNPDWVTSGLAEKVLHSLYGDKSHPSIGYFTSSSKCLTQTISEFGIILNEELVKDLVKYLLKRIMGASITRNNAFANVTSLSIKFVDDIIFDKMNDGDKWIELKSTEDVDALDFTVDCPYDKVSKEEIEKLSAIKEEYKNSLASMKEEKKKAKAEQAEKRKNKKETTE